MDWETFYSSFRKPDFIPGYEISSRLGGGAFGDVYKARKQSIGKAYAIKFLKIEEDAQREAVERELAHVRHFAAIDHPNLVTIEDMGVVLGVPYLIMGYAGEDTLARRLKAGALSVEEGLPLFVQACRGVSALHDRRLVHFDLKPSNVFLKGDIARVGDYGLSKLLTDGRMTLSFGRGTPQYMAPEILRSRADHRADIYSLGVILYESLVGELPYKPQTEGGLVLREDDDPPAFPEQFPEALRPIVVGCLRRDAADRYATMGELLEALGQSSEQGEVQAIDWTRAQPARAPRGRTEPAGGAEGAGEGAAAAPAEAAGAVATLMAPTPVGSAPGSDAGSKNDSGSDSGSGSSRKGSDALEAAADLARGAAAVARGVWQGLRGEDSRAGASTTSAAPEVRDEGVVPPPAPAAAVDAGRNLRRAGRDLKDGLGRAQAGLERAQAGIASARARIEDRRAGRGAGAARGEAEKRARALVGTLNASSEPGALDVGPHAPQPLAAVPVPPRVQGGFLGTVLSTCLVAFEVLGALLGAVGRGLYSTWRLLVTRLLSPSGSLIARLLRLVVFITVMAVLGFVAVMVGLVFLEAVGVSR